MKPATREKLINGLVLIMSQNPELIELYLDAAGRAIIATGAKLQDETAANEAAAKCAERLKNMMGIEPYDEHTDELFG